VSPLLPDGLSERPLLREDAALVAELLVEDERSFGQDPKVASEDVLAWWLRTDLEHNSWLVEEADGRPVAGGWIEPLGGWAFAVGSVRPGAKSRGLGSWLIDRSEGRARELELGILRQATLGVDPKARALFEGRDYREARRHWDMVIDLEGAPPAPQLPEVLAIDTFELEDARAFHAASSEAFADEWGHSPMAFEEWWAMRSEDPAFDPTLWFVVRDNDELAAVMRCEAGRHGGGFVGMLGVRKPWRRQGLGLALLLHAFHEFQKRGLTRVSLGVDSENPTGATRLYERAGMRVKAEYVTFEKELA
jgi:ribosomal protein S18 acetylase RimI-like enzyme